MAVGAACVFEVSLVLPRLVSCCEKKCTHSPTELQNASLSSGWATWRVPFYFITRQLNHHLSFGKILQGRRSK